MYFAMDSRKIPMVRLVNETVIDPPYVHRRRIPHEWIIYLVKNGRMEPEEDGILYHLSPGDFLLLDPEGRHEGREAMHCEYFYIHFQHMDIRAAGADGQLLRERMYQLRSDGLGNVVGEGADTSWNSYLQDRKYHLQAAHGDMPEVNPHGKRAEQDEHDKQPC